MRNRNDIPFSPRRWPFFYGWAVVGFGALGLLMSAPGQTIGVGPFTESLMSALKMSRGRLAMAYMVGTVGSALLLTPAGKLYDRLGARVLAPLAAVSLGGVLILLSQCDRLAAALAGTLGPAAASFTVIAVGFFGLRFCGQGVLTMVSRNMIVKWFDRHRGIAIGIGGVFFSLCMSASPLVLRTFIDAFSWRGAWWATAAIVGGGFSILALIFFRDNPEACGLLPDGGPGKEGSRRGRRHTAVRTCTLAEAVRSYSFWIFALSGALYGFYVTGLMFHVEAVFRDRGMSRDEAYSLFVPAAAISVALRLLTGWASDHVRLKHLLAVMLAAIAVSVMGFIALGPGAAKWMIIVGNGVCTGLMGVVLSVAWPRFFGRTHLGAISGAAMALAVLFSAVGPWLFSLSLKHTGSFDAAGWACLAGAGLLMLAAVKADNPQKRFAASGETP